MPLYSYEVNQHPLGFKSLFAQLQHELVEAEAFIVGEWQSQKMDMPMRELRNVSLNMKLPDTASELATMTGAHLPWAEDHFLERVGGEPLNPSPSEAWWPFARKQNSEHKSEGEAFSHTYPERMWPKYSVPLNVPQEKRRGIRFEYGDLGDVVNQLLKTPHTRQAFLPIWFPEDTGAVHGKRVPCTLGYHFAIRGGVLDITYYMRSTDLLRHFQDDIYLAGRLAQWIVQGINQGAEAEAAEKLAFDEDPRLAMTHPDEKLKVGELIFHTANLHIFDGDVPMIEYRRSQGQTAWAE